MVHTLPSDDPDSDFDSTLRRLLGSEPFEMAGRLYVVGAARPRADVLVMQEIAWGRDGALLLGRKLMTVGALGVAIARNLARPAMSRTEA